MCIIGTISNDVTFIHKTFPVPPSMRAIIEVKVSFPISSIRLQDHCPLMGIYTTRDHVNLRKRCTERPHGQLGNEILHSGISTTDRLGSRLRCKNGLTNMLHGIKKITVQDFIPRKFSFSFGFHCDQIDIGDSLKGLLYNISISVTNETECFKLPFNNTCHRYLQYGVLHNLMGEEYETDEHLFWINRFSIVDGFRYILDCYQHLHEFLCYVFVPKWDPVQNK